MRKLAATMKPGSSALFELVRSMTPDKALEELRGSGGTVLKTSLSHEDEAKLQAALSAGGDQEDGHRARFDEARSNHLVHEIRQLWGPGNVRRGPDRMSKN